MLITYSALTITTEMTAQNDKARLTTQKSKVTSERLTKTTSHGLSLRNS